MDIIVDGDRTVRQEKETIMNHKRKKSNNQYLVQVICQS